MSSIRMAANAYLAGLLILGAVARADAETIFVKSDATGANDGSSWTDAYVDLQQALSAAVPNDEIWVAEGTYKPGSLSTSTFQLKDQVSLYGGFAGTESEREQRDWAARPTILSGDLLDDDNTTIWYGESSRQDNVYHVVSADSTVQSGLLDGFVIEGGNAGSPNSPNESGAGVYCNSAPSVTLINCILRKNTARSEGAALKAWEGTATLVNCLVTMNSASLGGGLSVNNTTLVLTDVTCEWNYSQLNGGAVYTSYKLLQMTRCVFQHNDAWSGSGGGIYCNNAFTATGCTFSDNTAWTNGGGVCFDSSASGNLVDCAFTHNEVWQQNGGGLYVGYQVQLIGCSFQDNRAWYSAGGALCIQKGSWPISNCSFVGNEASTYGGGIYIASATSSPAITGCILDGNSANRGGGLYSVGCPSLNGCFVSGNFTQDSGGGLYSVVSGTGPSLYDCLFTGNTAGNSGCAVFDSSAGPTLTNCTFSKNLNAQGGESLLLAGSSTNKARVTNCIFWDNGTPISGGQPAVTYTCIQGGHDGSGNIDGDPLFVDADGADNVVGTLDDDLRLSGGSPCIDAGYNYAAWLAGLTADLDGNPRFSDDANTADTGNGLAPLVDMGAYEFDPPPDADNDGVPDGPDQCPGTVPGATVDANGCPEVIPGDFNRDGDVDADDLDQLEVCASGPGMSQTGEACAKAKLDGDEDVDQTDFGLFQRCMSGENVPASPGCAD